MTTPPSGGAVAFGVTVDQFRSLGNCPPTPPLRCLNTVLAVYEYVSFAKSWQEKGSSSQAETWQLKNILMKDFD